MTGRGVTGAEPAAAPGAENVAFLDQALWRQLKDAESPEAYAEAWLGLLCRTIDGAARGVVMLGPADTGPFTAAAGWPVGEAREAALLAAADAAIAERRGVVKAAEGGDGENAHVAYPFLIEGRLYGAVALEVAGEPGPHLRTVMRQIQWGSAWIDSLLRRQINERDHTVLERTKAALDFLATALEEERFLTACTAVVTALATRLDLERASIGFVKRGSASVATISHSARFGRRMKLIRQIGGAMDEAVDQRTAILYPDDAAEDDSLIVTLAHRDLAEGDGGDIILTLPLTVRDGYAGALTLERLAGRPFDSGTVEIAEGVAAALGPLLDEKRRNDRWLITKIGDTLWQHLGRLLGPAHVGRKLIAAAVVSLVAFFYLATGDYRVTSEAKLEGLVRRVVVASFSGYIAAAYVRAGDRVRAGDLLATLDDKDLALERLQWVTTRQEKLKEYDRALAEGDRARANIARVQVEGSEAQIALIDEQLARARLIAPFDGLVVAGDLSQSIGGAVERGEVLFEIAPLDAYRVILRVDESEIAAVWAGQNGVLRVSSVPDVLFPFTVEKVTPVAEAEGGQNTFRVEATLNGASDRLLPGMEGIGKIIVGERRLIWIWSRTLIDRVRLWLWYWGS